MTEKRNSTPKVTVIMPAYNAARFIEEAVMSVVNQTFADWELIVIDDGSKDETVQLAERIACNDSRIKVIRNEKNIGVARTRNRGFDIAAGEYIALLDSDDVWVPEKLEKQLKLAEETGADIVYCSYGMIDENGKKFLNDFIVPSNTDFDKMLIKSVISCSTCLLSCRVYKKYRFRTEFYHEDYVMWMNLLKDGYKAEGCTDVLAQYRQLSGSRASNKVNAAKNRWIVYRKYLKLSMAKSVKSIIQYAFAGAIKYYKK